MHTFTEWVETKHPEFVSNEGFKSMARNAMVGAGLLGAGMMMGNPFTSNSAQTQQPPAAMSTQQMQSGLKDLGNGKYVYTSPFDTKADQRVQTAKLKAVQMKAANEFMRATGSNMQGVQHSASVSGNQAQIIFQMPSM